MKDLEDVSPHDFWYLVGLFTADGNLSKNGRHLSVVSKDTELLVAIQEAFGITAKIASKPGGYTNKPTTFLQFGSVPLYKRFLEIGLTPNKSLTLGKLNIPDKYFPDFLRGEIDGDGNIRRWIHPQNGGEQWELRIYSGAPLFSHWLFQRIKDYFHVRGIFLKNEGGVYVLKFGKMAAREILSQCYRQNTLAMPRKRTLAQECIASYRGWAKSFTIET